ncbi:hypothetical protein [Paracoccus sp. (in: a-proteobacteria)]|uniref:hypothetical protein n=1 Tax=Paracoccus sp. TaxID=267 RepID=UPI003A8BB274
MHAVSKAASDRPHVFLRVGVMVNRLDVSCVSMRLAAMAAPLSIIRDTDNIDGMETLAITFSVLMIAAAIAATILVGMFAGGLWGALAFAAVLVATYRALTRQSGSLRPMCRSQLNAFQRPLATKRPED